MHSIAFRSQKCFLMPRKCYLDRVTNHFVFLPQDFFGWYKIFFLGPRFFSWPKNVFLVIRKKNLVARKKNLAARFCVLGTIFFFLL